MFPLLVVVTDLAWFSLIVLVFSPIAHLFPFVVVVTDLIEFPPWGGWY